jgi:hypothetical protein
MADLIDWLLNLIGSIAWYISTLWQVLWAALTLNPKVLQAVESYPQSRWLVAGIVVMAGASMLMGQSTALFLNRVKPGRFVASLVLNGFIFIISWSVWAITLWLLGRRVFGVDMALGTSIRLICLSTAPLVFGFFILIPYLGTFIGRVLSVWGLLITLGALRYIFQIGYWPALACVGVGWLLMWLLTNSLGRPVVALRNRVWHRVVGSPLDATAADILATFAGEGSDEPAVKGSKP